MAVTMHRSSIWAVVGCAALGACGGSGQAAGDGLASLSVSPLTLIPDFSPDVHDYVVYCGAGDNALSVTMAAAQGAVASIAQPAASSAAESQTVSVAVSEDQAVVVQAGTQSYWIRCLPHDFPAIGVARHPEVGTVAPGWYLLGTGVVPMGQGGFAIILDRNATPVWYHRASAGVFNVDRFDDGHISYTSGTGTFGSAGDAQYVLLRMSPWQVEAVRAVGAPTDEHELRVLPNGDRLLLSNERVRGVDLTGLAAFGAGSTIADCVVQEIDPNGGLVWQWRGSEHIDAVKESTDPQTAMENGETVVDVFHCNSIDVGADGNLLVSARHADAVFFVDRTSGSVVWKLGGRPTSKDGAKILQLANDPEAAFFHQHDARFRPDGHISLFDNHSKQPGVARGVEYALDVGAGTATFVWQYAGAQNSVAMGSFRRYDGSNVVDWGLSQGLTFSEVDDDDEVIQEVSVKGSSSYRTVKVPLDALSIDDLRATAGHP
jgi:hypothetical protein